MDNSYEKSKQCILPRPTNDLPQQVQLENRGKKWKSRGDIFAE